MKEQFFQKIGLLSKISVNCLCGTYLWLIEELMLKHNLKKKTTKQIHTEQTSKIYLTP